MKVGKIISVEYDKFKVRLFNSVRNSTSNVNGQVYYFGNIGSYLKSSNSIGEAILCEVVAVLDYKLDSATYALYNLDSSRELVIKPIGTISPNKQFSMGVGIYPSLYNDVDLVTIDDLEAILSFSKENKELEPEGIHSSIDLGISKSLLNYKIKVDINRLFGIHTAVLGNSGSGKSNTIAHILQEVFRKESNSATGAKFILFDSNGEYKHAFDGSLSKNIHCRYFKPNFNGLGYEKFVLPYFLMNLDEWLAFLMASDRTQKPFWDSVLQECFRFYKILNPETDQSQMSNNYCNYIKWTVYNILLCIQGKADSEASRMTAAKGMLSEIEKVVIANDKIIPEFQDDLNNFVSICRDLCMISFGNNNNSLAGGLPKFLSTGDEKGYVSTTFINQRGSEHYDTNIQQKKSHRSFLQIDENLALAFEKEKLSTGIYFDYRFLKTAVDIVLLKEEAKGNLRIRENTSTMLSRLDFFLTNEECSFMKENSEIISAEDYLHKILGIGSSSENQLIIIDSSEVGIDILELITSVTSRMIFDFRKSKIGENRRKNPVHVILDEAHRYIKKDTDYILRDNIFEKIAREGRKYSFYLIVSSQRPSELSQTVLSQCGNYIVHRIQNEVDMKYIYSVLPYFSEDYITRIKQQVPGEALVFGNCVPMPLQIKIVQANPDTDSKNCDIKYEWFHNTDLNIKSNIN